MPDQHARLSASGAHRWINCPGSLNFEAAFPDQSSAFALEGTQAHSLAEKKLRSWIKTGKRAHFKCEDEAMNEYTDQYRDYCIEVFNEVKAKDEDAEIRVETRLDYSDYAPGGFGTGDCVIVGSDTAHIIDLKYGKGVEVDAEDNPQLRLYALGLYQTEWWWYGFKKIKMHIVQPRIGNISVSEINTNELLTWAVKTLKPAAKRALEPDAVKCCGSWCRFCKGKGACAVKARQMEKEISGFGCTHPDSLSPEELSSILSQADDWLKWIKAVQEYALDEALNGAQIPRFKLVEGRSVRKVSDESKLITILTDAGFCDIYKPKELLSLTALEKTVGKKNFSSLASECITKPAGKPTLVPESDKRPALNSAELDFKEEI